MTGDSRKREKNSTYNVPDNVGILSIPWKLCFPGKIGKDRIWERPTRMKMKNAFSYLNSEEYPFSKFQMVGSGCCKLTPGGFRKIVQSNMW